MAKLKNNRKQCAKFESRNVEMRKYWPGWVEKN